MNERTRNRKVEWEGERVRFRDECRNGVGVIPVGALGTIERVSPGKFHVRTDKCEHCGVQILITMRFYGAKLPRALEPIGENIL